jgi:hypothetical protein
MNQEGWLAKLQPCHFLAPLTMRVQRALPAPAALCVAPRGGARLAARCAPAPLRASAPRGDAADAAPELRRRDALTLAASAAAAALAGPAAPALAAGRGRTKAPSEDSFVELPVCACASPSLTRLPLRSCHARARHACV